MVVRSVEQEVMGGAPSLCGVCGSGGVPLAQRISFHYSDQPNITYNMTYDIAS